MWINNLALKFKEIANSFPNDVAIYLDNEKITYKELDIYSDKIAKFLLTQNINSQDVINISSLKIIEAFAIIVACWKTGIIYSFIDRELPITRIGYILEICQPKLIIGEKLFINKISNLKHIKLLSYENMKELIKHNIEEELNTNLPGNLIAYIMFTSGSTGVPNGVSISHESLLQFGEWSKNEYCINRNDNISGLNPLFFDNSVFDIYSSLLNGASLIPLSREVVKDPKQTIKVLNQLKITIWFSVPSLLIYYLSFDLFDKDSFKDLKYIVFGGEGFPKNKLKKLYEIFKNRVILSNVYGPTEATCICSNYFINASDFNDSEITKLSPLGKILNNFSFYILDDNLKPVKNGNVGELVLGGIHLSKGYYNNNKKTKERFIQNPNNTYFKETIYLTGDLVKISPENNLLYFHGRKDSQIKFMGYRIELGEIEANLSILDGINECAVLFGEKDKFNQITCFLSSNLDLNYIKEFMKKKLPLYMIPRKFIFLENLPRNENGKIDKKKIHSDYYD